MRRILLDPGPDRAQQRGPITDTIGRSGSWSVCIHGKRWPEGDRFEDAGGRACRECVIEAQAGER